MVPTWPTGSPNPSPPPTTHHPFYVYWVLCPYLPPPPPHTPSSHGFLSSLHLFYKPKCPPCPPTPSLTLDVLEELRPLTSRFLRVGSILGVLTGDPGLGDGTVQEPGTGEPGLLDGFHFLSIGIRNPRALPYLLLRHNLNLIKLPPPSFTYLGCCCLDSRNKHRVFQNLCGTSRQPRNL